MQKQHSEIQQILLSTHEEIRNLKLAFESHYAPIGNATEGERQRIYSDLHQKLNKLEAETDQKFGKVLQKSLLSSENTINRQPTIQTDNMVALPKIPRSQSTKEFMITNAQRTFSNFAGSSKGFYSQAIINNPNSRYTQDLLRNKYNIKPINTNPERSSSINSSNSRQSSLSRKSIMTAKHTKPIGTIPKAIRDNPYAVPPLTDRDVDYGMMSLVNRGLVPKDFDLTLPLERLGTGMVFKKAVIYNTPREAVNSSTQMAKSPFITTVTSRGDFLSKVKSTRRTEASTSRLFATKRHTQTETQDHNHHLNAKNKHRIPDGAQTDRVSTLSKEIVDTNSGYHFVIRRGKTVREAPEFSAFKLNYFGIWEQIESVLLHLERLLGLHDVKIAYVSGQKLADLSIESARKPALQELLNCIVNKREIERFINHPHMKYYGSNRETLAAIKIQSVWRMHSARKKYKKSNNFFKRLLRVQNCARIFLKHRRTVQEIKLKKDRYRKECDELTEQLKKEWALVSNGPRIEIHLCGLNYDEFQRTTMSKFSQRQNVQITRLFALRDPAVHIIYVTPYTLPSDLIIYYSKVLELCGVTDFKERFSTVTPENQDLFPKHFSLSRTLLYSPKALHSVHDYIKGKRAYLVPSIPSIDDVQLAWRLGIPLLSGNDIVSNEFSKKSSSKKIFEECNIPTPVFVTGFRDEKTFIDKFVQTIAANPTVSTWFIKIDNEFEGRGLAWLNLESIKQLVDVRKGVQEIAEQNHETIKDALLALLPHKLKIAQRGLYRNYYEFVRAFKERGGVIEAAPNAPSSEVHGFGVSFFLAPNGSVKVLGSYDKVTAMDNVTSGYLFPQKSAPGLDLQALCNTVGRALYEKGIIGYCSVDLIAFQENRLNSIILEDKEKRKKSIKYWAVDLNCSMTPITSVIGLFDFLIQGTLDQNTGKYTIALPSETHRDGPIRKKSSDKDALSEKKIHSEEDREKRAFMYFPFLHHPGLSQLDDKLFFQLCRKHSISYDLENKKGTTFVLMDSIQGGTVGLITICRNRRTVINLAYEAVSFLMNISGPIPSKYQESLLETKNDAVLLTEIVNKLKKMQKITSKKSMTQLTH